MAKAVFRPTEITNTDSKVILKLSHNYAPEEEEEEISDRVETIEE